jgi:hypothetical protein
MKDDGGRRHRNQDAMKTLIARRDDASLVCRDAIRTAAIARGSRRGTFDHGIGYDLRPRF